MGLSDQLYKQFLKYLQDYDEIRKNNPQFVKSHDLNYAGTNEYLAAKYALEGKKAPWEYYVLGLMKAVQFVYDDLKPFEKFLTLHRFFDDFDLYLMSEIMTNEVSQGHNFLFIYENKFFINTSFFWKSQFTDRKKNFMPKTSGTYSEGFKTFGLCVNYVLYNLVDLTGYFEETFKKNPLFFLEELKISLFPFSRDYQVKFKLTGRLKHSRNELYFVSDNIFSSETKTEIDRLFSDIIASETHIACLPEMILCDETLTYIQEKLKLINPKFLILIAGSYHQLSADGYRNSMPVLVYFQGETKQLMYHKYEPFTTEVKKMANASDFITKETLAAALSRSKITSDAYEEYMENANITEDIISDLSVLIFNVREIGNIGFITCKDFLKSDGEMLKAYGALTDHLIVISFNKSEEAMFYERSKIAAREIRASIFYVNARCYDRNDDCPTFYYLPLKQKKEGMEKLVNKSKTISPEEPFLSCTIPVPDFRKTNIYL